MTLVYYLAAGTAVILVLVAAYREAFRTLTPANGFLLVLPLLLAFTVVVGLRVLVDRPAALEANWVFRLSETPADVALCLRREKGRGPQVPRARCSSAVLVVHAVALGPFGVALAHAAFGLIVSVLGVQAAFYHYRKIPFACSWVPGKLKLHFTVFPCLIGLLLSMMALAAIEKIRPRGARPGARLLAVAAAAGLALRQGNGDSTGGAPLSMTTNPKPP